MPGVQHLRNPQPRRRRDLEGEAGGGAHESDEEGADDLRAGTGFDARNSGQSHPLPLAKKKTQVGMNPTLRASLSMTWGLFANGDTGTLIPVSNGAAGLCSAAWGRVSL